MRSFIPVPISFSFLKKGLLFLLFLPALAFAQNSFECHTGAISSSGGRESEPACWPDYSPPCNEVIKFAPNPDFPEDTPIKYVKVVLHVFQNQDDPTVIHPPGNFTNSVEHMNVLRSWFHDPNLGINAKLANVCDPQPKVPGFESPHIPDARVRFLFDGIENQDVFFYNDPVLWAGGFYCCNFGSPYGDFANVAIQNNPIVQGDPNILNAVHVFMPAVSIGPNVNPNPDNPNNNNCPCGTMPSYTEGGYTFFNCTGRGLALFGNYYRYKWNSTGVSTWVNYEEPADPNLIPHGGNGILAEWFHMVSVDHPNFTASHLNTPSGITDHCDDTPLNDNVNNYMGGNEQPPLLKCGLTQCQLGRAHRFMDLIKPNYIRFPANNFQFPAPWNNCQIKDPDVVIGNNQSVIWDGEKVLYSNIVIESGSTLTIDCDVYMCEQAIITVEPGGRLNVNAKIAAECDSWLGIEVKGVPSVSQFSSGVQGRVYLTNGTIEDAQIGVSLFRRQTYAQGGGILYAQDSDFINCQKGVAIANYDNTLPGNSLPTRNLSYIRDCNFIINDDFFFDYGGEHIQLDRVTRVNITDNILKDDRTSYTSADELQNGIWSSNATYFLKGNVIEHMRYGVKAENIKAGRTFRATENTFTNNFFGISTRAVDNFEAIDNDFTVGGFTGPTTEFQSTDRQTGMMVDQSSGFFIEDNDFSAASNLLTVAEPVGLAVKNTNVGVAGDLNSDANEVFRNTFDGLHRANVANGQNADPSPASGGGLRYFCNQNNTVVANSPNYCTDFTVSNGNIAAVQRSVAGDAAGNTFTKNNLCNTLSDFDNIDGNFITYHYYNQSAGNIEDPIFFDQSIFDKTTAQINDCTNGDSSPGPIPPNQEGSFVTDFPNARSNYQGLRQQYAGLLDGGDTDMLLNGIATAPPNSHAIIQQLNQITPYLSSTVLLAVTESNSFTANGKKYILCNNPEGLRNTVLLNSVENGGWFSTQQITAIQGAVQNTTARTQTEANLRVAQAALQGITQALENYYQLDEADNGLDYSNQGDWAANGESLDGYLRSIDNRLWAQDITSANSEITALQAMTMSTKQSQEIGYFVQLKNLEIDLLNSSRDYNDATSTEIISLQTIAAQSSARAGIQAQNWLHLLGISEAQAEAYWETSSSALMSEGSVPNAQIERTLSTTANYISVQPNPSTNLFQFHYRPQVVQQQGDLTIYDLSGKLVYQQAIVSGEYHSWQPQGNTAGFYFFSLKDKEGNFLQQGKLIYLP